MAFQFPINPTVGQSVLNPTSSQYYTWNGTAWTQYPTSASYAISSSYSVTSSYAVNGGGGGATITISDNAPTGSQASTGSLWFNSDNLGLYVRYQDQDSTQWVAASAVGPVATASIAFSSSFATTASYAQTASRLIILDPTPASGTSIASGSGLTYNTSTSTFVVDTVEGIANNNVAFVTPWNFSLKMDSAGQQFYISVDATGATKYAWGTKIANYNLVNTGAGSTNPGYSFWSAPVAGTWYSWWKDGTLNMGSHGDTETGIFRVATGQTPFSLGLYEEYQITMVLGAGYNNNYFRVTKTK